MDISIRLQNFANAFARKGAAYFRSKLDGVAALATQVADRAYRTVEQEINAIPGRSLFYTLTARQDFTAADEGLEGEVLTFECPKDGPFIATHYPIASFIARDSDGSGIWQPVGAWPLPEQVLSNNWVDISLSFQDQGPGGRRFESAPNLRTVFNEPSNQVLRQAPGGVFSRPSILKRLPVPTLFPPKTIITCVPRYDQVNLEAYAGELVVCIPGYRKVNK